VVHNAFRSNCFWCKKDKQQIFAFFIFLAYVNYLDEEKEGIKSELEVGTLLMLAITLHNIPEGMAIAVPLRSRGESRIKSFFMPSAQQ